MLAAVFGDGLISAALTGPHQRRLIDPGGHNRLYQPLHFHIFPDTIGVIFERMQLGKIETHISSFTPRTASRGGRLFSCDRGLRLGWGGLILHCGSSFGRLYFFGSGGTVYLPGVGETLFIVSHLKTAFVLK